MASNVRSLVHRYEAASTSELPPPSPARFLPRRGSSSIPTPLSQLTTSATLIDDLSRHPDSDSDDESFHKPTPSAESPPASHSTLHRHRSTPHTPIPATVVFARNAPSLSLPKLDEYLSKLIPPSFAHATAKEPTMFPPMDQLAKSGSTIEDLEYNLKIAPWYRNRNTLLGSAVNAVLGITVRRGTIVTRLFLNSKQQGSSAVSTFYSLQGLSNTIQVFALILTTIGSNPV